MRARRGWLALESWWRYLVLRLGRPWARWRQVRRSRSWPLTGWRRGASRRRCQRRLPRQFSHSLLRRRQRGSSNGSRHRSSHRTPRHGRSSTSWAVFLTLTAPFIVNWPNGGSWRVRRSAMICQRSKPPDRAGCSHCLRSSTLSRHYRHTGNHPLLPQQRRPPRFRRPRLRRRRRRRRGARVGLRARMRRRQAPVVSSSPTRAMPSCTTAVTAPVIIPSSTRLTVQVVYESAPRSRRGPLRMRRRTQPRTQPHLNRVGGGRPCASCRVSYRPHDRRAVSRERRPPG